MEEIQLIIELERAKFKPSLIKYLIVTEAPPEDLKQFFYNPNVNGSDFLFLAIMGILYQDIKIKYLKMRRPPELKMEMLHKFREDGYYCIDFLPMPKAFYPSKKDAVPDLINRVSATVNKGVPIIIIKASVYDQIYGTLMEHGYNVINERIPFPNPGQQSKFEDRFRSARATAIGLSAAAGIENAYKSGALIRREAGGFILNLSKCHFP